MRNDAGFMPSDEHGMSDHVWIIGRLISRNFIFGDEVFACVDCRLHELLSKLNFCALIISLQKYCAQELLSQVHELLLCALYTMCMIYCAH